MDDHKNGSDRGEYIDSILQAICKWKKQTPSILSQAIGVAAVPISWLVDSIIPTSAIQGAWAASDWVVKNTTTKPGASSFDELKELDRNADQVINVHIATAAAEGGAAGFFGLPAMMFDVAAVVMLAQRLVRQIGCEYGFNADTVEETEFVFSVLSAASANSQMEKVEAIVANAYLMNMIAKNTWKKIAETAATKPIGGEAAVIAIRNLAKQLGINITKRSALAAIPVIGAAVGATANGWFIRDVGIAAQRMYQERWLRYRGFWIDCALDSDAGAAAEATAPDAPPLEAGGGGGAASDALPR